MNTMMNNLARTLKNCYLCCVFHNIQRKQMLPTSEHKKQNKVKRRHYFYLQANQKREKAVATSFKCQ